MPQHPTFFEELMAAGRGVFALLLGDRKAAGFFDTSQRGLVTSFIALLLAVAVRSFLPIIVSAQHDTALSSVAQYAILFAMQLGCAIIVLRQVKRMDALVPYLVADNWAVFYLTLISAAVSAAGIGADSATATTMVLIFDVAGIVLEINIGRIVMSLAPLQIGMLIVAQLVGGVVAIGITWAIFGIPPDVAAQLGSLGQ